LTSGVMCFASITPYLQAALPLLRSRACRPIGTGIAGLWLGRALLSGRGRWRENKQFL